ncbi:hypothetical protein K2173_016465 [Erythroxylum novogranatense]|uniref:Uncharacterized protein n=1 Tax=Erythroxylum novogranatense TaxID=1862640 RepID=A0AAV8SGM6_9ROSI|nr:hypothetical protein K2173_016465 [Erythroxylum novogranatense]
MSNHTMCLAENNLDSDTDSNPDESLQYYQPIDAEDDSSDHGPENGFATLHLNEDGETKGTDDDDDQEDEEETIREASNTATLRALTEDERRRNAPLTPENAARVMEGMRRVSFAGLAPDWARRVPEDQWIHQLRRLRRPPSPCPSGALGN